MSRDQEESVEVVEKDVGDVREDFVLRNRQPAEEDTDDDDISDKDSNDSANSCWVYFACCFIPCMLISMVIVLVVFMILQTPKLVVNEVDVEYTFIEIYSGKYKNDRGTPCIFMNLRTAGPFHYLVWKFDKIPFFRELVMNRRVERLELHESRGVENTTVKSVESSMRVAMGFVPSRLVSSMKKKWKPTFHSKWMNSGTFVNNFVHYFDAYYYFRAYNKNPVHELLIYPVKISKKKFVEMTTMLNEDYRRSELIQKLYFGDSSSSFGSY